MATMKENSLTNPKRTLARRESEAEGTSTPPAKKAAPASDMSQSKFSGYDKPRKKNAAGLEKALKKRG